MGEIRKDNLHESLIEELNELANIDLSGKQDKTDESLLTESKDVIGAINELFQSANNGKELIASAIGEPLDASDTFSAMSNDINGLLSTFKTNMMNNGITVESSDKFKSLIDKIATMVEEGRGKGIQFVSGIAVGNKQVISGWHLYGIEIQDLNFTPCLIYAYDDKTDVACLSNLSGSIINNYRCYVEGSIGNHTASYDELMFDNGFKIIMSTHPYTTNVNWWAIGVGEDDTTLRDSLASILTEEGVSVTEEDDMASLISKVNEEFDKQVVPAGNAVAANVLTGKTFINSTGNTLTGTMANNGTKTITPKASAQTLGAGYYDKITINGDADLVAANIVSGKNIFGVTGTATLENVAKAGSTYSLMPYYYTNGTLSRMVLAGTFSSFTHMISLFVPLGGTMTVNCKFSAGSSTTTAELKIEQVRDNNSIWSKIITASGNTGVTVNENVSNLKFGDIIKLSIRTVSGDKGAQIIQPVLKFSL